MVEIVFDQVVGRVGGRHRVERWLREEGESEGERVRGTEEWEVKEEFKKMPDVLYVHTTVFLRLYIYLTENSHRLRQTD